MNVCMLPFRNLSSRDRHCPASCALGDAERLIVRAVACSIVEGATLTWRVHVIGVIAAGTPIIRGPRAAFPLASKSTARK